MEGKFLNKLTGLKKKVKNIITKKGLKYNYSERNSDLSWK